MSMSSSAPIIVPAITIFGITSETTVRSHGNSKQYNGTVIML